MKKLYIASILCAMPFCFAGATSSSDVLHQAPAKVTPEDPSDLTLKFGYDNSEPAIFITFKAPTHEKSYSGQGAQLTQNLDKIEINRRVLGSYEWEKITTFENVTPGATLSFTDKDIEEGETYTYNPVAYIGEDGSSTWNYESIYAGIRPEAPSVTATSFRGSAPVTLTITAPSRLEGGDPIEMPLTGLRIERMIGYGEFETVHTISSPTAGETYEWTDEDYKKLTDGVSVSYQVYALIGNFSSQAGTANITLKKDTPSYPESVTAVETEDGVAITWTPVTTGASGYWFDPAEVTYNVYRVTKSGNETQIASQLTECSFTDDLSDVTSINSYAWKVAAENAQGEGYGATSEYMTLGPAATLPYDETFNTPGSYRPSADNLWTPEIVEGYYDFNVHYELFFWSADYDMYIYDPENPEGSDRTQGFLYFEGSSYSKCEALYTTAPISAENITGATLSFDYFVIPGSKSLLYVEIVDPNGETTDDNPYANATPVALIFINGDEHGWQEKTISNIDLSDYSEFQLRLHALTDPEDGKSGVVTPICIDNIHMEGNKTNAVGSIEGSEATVLSTEYYDLSGLRISNPTKGSIVIAVERMSDGSLRHSKVRF